MIDDKKWRLLLRIEGFNHAVGNIEAAVDINGILDNQVVAFFFGQIHNHAVGALLQSGKLFVAAQIILFGKLGLLQAVLAGCQPLLLLEQASK